MQKYKAVFFDLDGTILDSFDFHSKVHHGFLNSKGFSVDMESVRRNIGNTIECVLDGCGIPKEAQPDIICGIDSYFVNGAGDLLDGLLMEEQGTELIAGLKEKGFKTGIVTNSKHALLLNVLRNSNAEQYFDILSGASADSLDKQLRFLDSIRSLGILPEEVLYVGDTGYDIALARLCGTDICIVRHTFGWEADYDKLIREGKPDYVVDSLKEVAGIAGDIREA